jgi:hypothetical protein
MDVTNNFNSMEMTQNIYQPVTNENNEININIDMDGQGQEGGQSIQNTQGMEGMGQVGGAEQAEPNIKGVFTLAEENKLPSGEEQQSGIPQQFMQGQGGTEDIIKLIQAMQGQGSAESGAAGGETGGVMPTEGTRGAM